MTKARYIALCAALAAGLATTAQAAPEKLKFSTFGTPANPMVKCAWLKVANEIVASADGALTLEPYMGGTAFGNPRKQYDFIARGVMDLSSGVLAYKQGAFPLTGLINLPFMVEDNVSGSIALNRVVRKSLMNEFSQIHLMLVALVSPYQFHMRAPISGLEDLKGKRIRIAGKAATAALKALGAQPAPMPITQSYENLQKGVIDGVGSTWTSILAFRLAEVTKFHYEVDFAVPSVFLGMSKKAYARLPAKARATVDKLSTPEQAGKIAQCWARTTKPAKAMALKRGNTIKVASAADRARYRTMLQPVTDKLIADLEARGLPARNVYNEMRTAIAVARKEAN
jgi:TRAP-type transport system periplasmic protein